MYLDPPRGSTIPKLIVAVDGISFHDAGKKGVFSSIFHRFGRNQPVVFAHVDADSARIAGYLSSTPQ